MAHTIVACSGSEHKSAPPLMAVRQARADALLYDIRGQGGLVTWGFLIHHRAYRRNPGGWSLALLDRALNDLVERGAVEVRATRDDVAIRVIEEGS
jgi:hypothetical protein